MYENALVGHEYVEPYAGGASVGLSLLFEDYASHIVINDFDPGVFTFWKIVLERPDELCARILRTRVTMAEWRRQKKMYHLSQRERVDELDLAFLTFFLNRTNRSGIIDGGPIGGVRQMGAWKLDARYNKKDLVRRIRKISRFRSRITVSGLDAHKFLRRWTKGSQGSLIYLDPPYYSRGNELYSNYYDESDHVGISKLVRELRALWLVSYDAVPPIARLYRGYRKVNYSLNYSAASRYRGREVMYFSPGLNPPKLQSPTNIPVTVVERKLGARYF
jgi:DNA adenine methylase